MNTLSASRHCIAGARSFVTCAVAVALAPYARDGNAADYAGDPQVIIPCAGRYATIFAVAARCHASAGVHMRRLSDAIRPFNAVRVRVLCR